MPIKLLILVLILATPLIPTFWALQDIPKRRFETSRKKMVWFFVVSTLPFFGAMLYIVFARRHTDLIEISQP